MYKSTDYYGPISWDNLKANSGKFIQASCSELHLSSDALSFSHPSLLNDGKDVAVKAEQ